MCMLPQAKTFVIVSLVGTCSCENSVFSVPVQQQGPSIVERERGELREEIVHCSPPWVCGKGPLV